VHTALSNAQQAHGVGLGIISPDPASAGPQAPMPMPSADLDAATDVDGWSYGDNKWEGMGPKGGMGKVGPPRRLNLMFETDGGVVYATETVAPTGGLYRGDRVYPRREAGRRRWRRRRRLDRQDGGESRGAGHDDRRCRPAGRWIVCHPESGPTGRFSSLAITRKAPRTGAVLRPYRRLHGRPRNRGALYALGSHGDADDGDRGAD
jgi:hypothetical protein